MNLRRGFFRLWLVFSALFVIATAVVYFKEVKSEFEMADFVPDLPVSCPDVPRGSPDAPRGRWGDDYTIGGDGYCWYSVGKFRALYPEYKDLSEDQLYTRLYEKAGKTIRFFAPWTLLLKVVSIGIGAPLIVLALGSAIGWSFAGFSSERKKSHRDHLFGSD